ncbi:unnamed protein product [Ectocarpus fasciculatus]
MNRIKNPISDKQMERFWPATRGRILEYQELSRYTDIEQILPSNKSFVIILIEYKQNEGHWISVARYGKTIEFFNSYGKKHSKYDFMESKQLNRYLGQASMHLRYLLEKEAKEAKFDIVYNTQKFQRESDDVNTCGRHVLMRLITLVEMDMDLSEYIQFMRQAKRDTKKSYDRIVSDVIY